MVKWSEVMGAFEELWWAGSGKAEETVAEGDWGRRPVSGSMQVARGEDAEDVEGEEGDEPGEVFWGE